MKFIVNSLVLKPLFTFIVFICLTLFCYAGKQQNDLKTKASQLQPCPSSPNCVSSQSGDEKHRISPFTYTASQDEAYARLKKILNEFNRMRIIEEDDDYLHVEFKSAIFRFVDKVEFQFDDNQKIIHLRSASMTGYYDFGVNRRRIEEIRKKFSPNP